MHGALLDGIERFTEKQQQIAVRQRLEKQRRAAIKEATMGDADTSAGNGSHVLQYVAEAGLAFALAWILDGTGMIDDGEKTEIVPFYRSTELRELRQRIVDLVNAMPAQERSVLQRHYFQELPFQELADMLGVSRGRISQIHRKALGRLKEKLRGKRDCDVAW